MRTGGTLVASTDKARNYVTRGLKAPRTAIVRALRLHGARGQIESPASPYTPAILPAVLQLLGERTWAFPSGLDRHLPRFALEHDGPVPRPRVAEEPS